MSDKHRAACRAVAKYAATAFTILGILLIQAPKIGQAEIPSTKTGVQTVASSHTKKARCNWRDSRACGKNQRIGIKEASKRGWKGRQWVCLKRLWYKESGWSVRSGNPYHGSFGIPQALPGRKMASAGPRWRTDARTQIRWGLKYIDGRYGSPCGAWRHWQSHHWY